MVVVKIYRNKYNQNKYIEIHYYKCRHKAVKQFMMWNNGVKNYLGDRCLHRWNKKNLSELLEDYEEREW